MSRDNLHSSCSSLIAEQQQNMTYKHQEHSVVPTQTRSPHQRRPNSRRRSKNSPTSGNVHKIPKFLRSLYAILQREDSAVIAWVENQQLIPNRVTAFHILDMARFEREILPKYFKHQKFASFQRQLNNFGFRKWTKTQSSGVCTFSHNCFPPDPSALVNGLMRIANRDHWRQHRGSSCALDSLKQSSRELNKVHLVRYGESAGNLPIMTGSTLIQHCKQSEMLPAHLSGKPVINPINQMGLTVKSEPGDEGTNNCFGAARASPKAVSNCFGYPLRAPSPRGRFHGILSHQRGQSMRVGLKRSPNSSQLPQTTSNLNSNLFSPDSFLNGVSTSNLRYDINFSVNQSQVLSGQSSTSQDTSNICSTNGNGMNYCNPAIPMDYNAAKQANTTSGLSPQYPESLGAITPNGVDGFGFFDYWDGNSSPMSFQHDLGNQQYQNSINYGTNSLVGLDLASYPMDCEFSANSPQQYSFPPDKQSPPQVDDFVIDNLLLVE